MSYAATRTVTTTWALAQDPRVEEDGERESGERLVRPRPPWWSLFHMEFHSVYLRNNSDTLEFLQPGADSQS